MLNRRQALFGMAASAAVVAAPSISFAQAGAVARKVNIAGRQRMFSQRMSMAAAMARLGIEPSSNVDLVGEVARQFEGAQNVLRNGSDELGIEPETHPSVLSSLDRVEQIWAEMSIATSGITDRGAVSRVDLQEMADLNLKLLSRANIVVKKIIKAYDEDDRSDTGLSQAIDMSGRQRMLSQKMIKEAALIGLKYRRADNREFLNETLTTFDESLFKLMYGDEDDGIPKPPADVLAKLQQVEALWLDLYPLMDEIATLGRADAFELTELSGNAADLLSMSNEAVFLYEVAATS